MWVVSKARFAASIALGLMMGAVAPAADTRPDDRGDWFRDPDTRNSTDHDGQDLDLGKPATRDHAGQDQDSSDRNSRGRDDSDSRRNGPYRPPYAGGYAPYTGNYAQYNDYPGNIANDWVTATVRAATARALFRRADSELDAAIRRAQRDFEKSRAYRQAVAAEKDAYDAYLASRSHALRDLADDSRYQSLIHLRNDLGDRIARRRAAHDISKEELLAMATLKLEYASRARSMEVSALNSDAAMKDARDKMVVASKRVSAMEEDFDDSLRDNPDLLIARRNLEDARISVIATSTYASSAQIAGDSAVNYSYYLHRNDIQRWDTGGGYSSPYWTRY